MRQGRANTGGHSRAGPLGPGWARAGQGEGWRGYCWPGLGIPRAWAAGPLGRDLLGRMHGRGRWPEFGANDPRGFGSIAGRFPLF